ncbi:hypothetical protein HFP57_13660 [Parasphingopyxis algicola]|uniref:hypothetical protein n=1 Tax=Parasphingopyxis algicola TaxID=2026624 RepID=UPI0015A13A4F|nr:hypothetical protein [Parasphingopyxis algicola]QLC25965.1 hypothetical protein HFP57_13660 [Parasphingopyxis algicola]
MPRIEVIPRKLTNDKSAYLRRFASNTYSQAGEDGIIAEIFRILDEDEPERDHWCVEFGAWDGLYLSNTARLIREEGWSAVLIEGDEERCAEIMTNLPYPDRVHAMHRWVGFERGKNTMDDILAETPIPKDFDFASIDVDSVDWHVWDAIQDYRPRLVCIEFNPSVPNSVIFVQDRDMGVNEGSSIAAMVELGKQKGYELICATGNGFFVREEEFGKFGIEDNSIDAMRPDRGNYLWTGYNGKIYHTLDRMAWWGRQVELKPTSLQLLSEFWFHGAHQGYAHELTGLEPDDGALDFDNPEHILREVYELRSTRKSLDPDEFKARQAEAWGAAKRYFMRNRGTHDIENPAEESQKIDSTAE